MAHFARLKAWTLDTWQAFSPRERLLIGACLLGLGALATYSVYSQLDRPHDIRNSNVAFVKDQQADEHPIRGAVSWPWFGFDRARTKHLDAPRLRPPFRQLWRYQRGALLEFTPVATHGRIFGVDNNAVAFALRAKRGTELWRHDFGVLNAASPAYHRGHLYVVTLDPPQALAIDAKNGHRVWQRDLPSRSESSPVTVGKRVFFGSEDGTVYALDTRSGETVWATRLEGEVKAAPAFHDGNLFVGDYAGKMYSIDADDGSINWASSDLGIGLGRSGRFYSTPAVAYGRVFAGNVDRRVYSFSEQTGEIAWTYSAANYVYSGVAVAETEKTPPAVYFGSHDTYLYSVDAESGSLNWKVPVGGQVSGPATVIGPNVYISTFTGNSTSGYDLSSTRRTFKLNQGQYGPVISNGRLIFVIGADTITALEPLKHSRQPGAGGKKQSGDGGTKLKERADSVGIIGAVPRHTGIRAP